MIPRSNGDPQYVATTILNTLLKFDTSKVNKTLNVLEGIENTEKFNQNGFLSNHV